MYRFWETATQPILEALQPQNIVEIGSDTGLNTKILLDFCEKNGAKLHVIDPLPKYDVSEWQERHSGRLFFYSALSLSAIPLVECSDIVLIDGDHNWYTVYNELKLIEKHSVKKSRQFPLVMLHDVGWPYGRRDLYYNPETIPDAYRHPCKQKGMDITSSELLEEGGLNYHLYNSIYENNLQNGVLTAVEDFIDSTEQELELTKVPGLHGLGILVPVELKAHNEELCRVLAKLGFPLTAKQHVESVERDRLETATHQQNVHAKLKEAVAERKEQEAKHKEQVSSLTSELKQCYEALQAKELEAEKAYQETEKKQKTIDELKQKYEILQAKELDTRKAHQEAEEARREPEKVPREAGKLLGWMEELNVAIPALLGSRRWKVGNALGELHQRLTSRPRVPMASEQLSHVLEEFRSWRNNSGGTPYTPSRTPEPLQAPKVDRAAPEDTKKAVDLGRENWHTRPVQVRSQEKSVVVYTAIAENYEAFKIPKVLPEGWDLVCFQDRWDKPSPCELRPFDFHHDDPTRRSRYVKLHPHVYFPDHEWSIWVDANLLIEGDLSPLVKRVREAQEVIGSYLHPHRSNIFEEADEVVKRGGLDIEGVVRQQVLRYREAGMFLQGLYETNVLVRLHNDERAIKLMNAWWRELENGSRRDQLSFPVVSYKLGIEPVALGVPGDSVRNSPLFTRFAHGHEMRAV